MLLRDRGDWCPEDIPHLGNDLEKNLCPNRWSLLVIEVIQDNLRENLQLAAADLLDLFVGSFVAGRENNQEHVVLLLSITGLDLLFQLAHNLVVPGITDSSLLYVQVHVEVPRGVVQDLHHIVGLEVLEADEAALDLDVAVEDLFVEELEVGD